jgi:5-methylcytosine-specific restriction endonuclease McrA
MHKLTTKKLESNRRNSKLGAAATKKVFSEKYLKNPSYCKQCDAILPQSKRRNTFCDSSCAAKYNNVIVPKRVATMHNCPNCDKKTKTSEGKYCSQECYNTHRTKYKTEEERIIARRKTTRSVTANYRAKLRGQTPPHADLNAIREFYDNCPDGYEVDHIIPISKGGLHILENLQYLTAIENKRKSNKLL